MHRKMLLVLIQTPTYRVEGLAFQIDTKDLARPKYFLPQNVVHCSSAMQV